MAQYMGKFADYYDLFYAEKDYDHECGVLDALIQQFASDLPKRLLELACGTGNHAIRLQAMGYKVHAFDGSPDMIKVARKKGQSKSSGPQFEIADMREFDFPGEQFGIALCLFDSLGYVRTNEALEQVFARVHKHLLPDGIFIFEVFHAAAMLTGYSQTRVRRWTLPTKNLTRISETSLDYPKQIATIHFTTIEVPHNDVCVQYEETHENRFFSVPELKYIVDHNGFVFCDVFAGYSGSMVIDKDTWHLLVVTRRRS